MSISIDDFKKLEIRIGEILKAEKIPETDKLFRLEVNFGLKPIAEKSVSSPEGGLKLVSADLPEGEGRDIRQIISGIALYFPEPLALVGKKCAFATNLEPRIIKGLESQGMILAVGGGNEAFSLLEVSKEVKAGAIIK